MNASIYLVKLCYSVNISPESEVKKASLNKPQINKLQAQPLGDFCLLTDNFCRKTEVQKNKETRKSTNNKTDA